MAPSSKRRVIEWADSDVAWLAGVETVELHHLYLALDCVHDAKNDLEMFLYCRLTDLTNLDLRFVFYDLKSTYFETHREPSDRFMSRAFGYSRDHRSDRPQVVIGLVMTSDGLLLAHHVFAGNTKNASTLDGVLDDLKGRFAIGRTCSSPIVVSSTTRTSRYWRQEVSTG